MKPIRPLATAGALLALMLACGLAQADAQHLLEYVPAPAEFVAGLNVRQMAQSPAVDTLVPAGRQREIENMARQFESYVGVNPLEDLEGVVIAGLLREDMPAAIFFHGQWERQRLVQAVAQNPTYASSLYRNVTIHSWMDDNKDEQQYAAFLADDVLVMASGQAGILQAIIAHHAEGGAGYGPIDLPAAQPLVFLSAAKPAAGAPSLEAMPVVSKVTRLVATLESDAGALAVRMHAATADEHSAGLIKEALEGALALLQLVDPDAQHAWRSEVVHEGAAVNLVVSAPLEKLPALAETLRRAKPAK